MSISERILLVLLIIVAGGLIAQSYVGQVVVGRQDIMGSAAYPRLIGYFLLAVSIYALFRYDILVKLKNRNTPAKKTHTEDTEKLFVGRALGLIIMTIIYILVLRLFGYFIASFLLMWVSMFYLHSSMVEEKGRIKRINKVAIKTFLTSIGVMIFLYIVFVKLFNIYLPPSTLIKMLR